MRAGNTNLVRPARAGGRPVKICLKPFDRDGRRCIREDLLFDAAEVIEARCPAMTPVDPR